MIVMSAASTWDPVTNIIHNFTPLTSWFNHPVFPDAVGWQATHFTKLLSLFKQSKQLKIENTDWGLLLGYIFHNQTPFAILFYITV